MQGKIRGMLVASLDVYWLLTIGVAAIQAVNGEKCFAHVGKSMYAHVGFKGVVHQPHKRSRKKDAPAAPQPAATPPTQPAAQDPAQAGTQATAPSAAHNEVTTALAHSGRSAAASGVAGKPFAGHHSPGVPASVTHAAAPQQQPGSASAPARIGQRGGDAPSQAPAAAADGAATVS